MAFLNWLQSTSIATWVLGSPSVWAQPTVMTLHTMGMGVLVGACWILDMRLLGVGDTIPLSAFRWVFKAVAISLIVNTITGVLLFAARAVQWGTAFPFLVKMLFVVASAATVLPMRTYVLKSDAGAPVGGRAKLMAVASIVAWAGAITSGRLLAYLVAG